MIRLNNKKFIAFINGKSQIIGEIFVDDTVELPAKNGFRGYELTQGSIAYVVNSGELYIMNSSGEWHKSEGIS